jgi:hypothetical protein
MKVSRFAIQLQYSMLAVTLLSVWPSRTPAQDDHSHTPTAQQQTMTPEQQRQASALIKIVQDATERFKDFEVAEQEGYQLQFGCVSGDQEGAMGLHFVNSTLVKNGVIDPKHPQIVIYEPTPDGHLRLIGADFLVLADAWDAAHPADPPQLMGQLFHLFTAPNRFALPSFYTLHVWAWKANPNGAFVNWHPNVSCQLFPGKTP